MTISLSSEPQADRDHTGKEMRNPLGERMIYRSEEVRGQVPGTKCNRARTKSAINNYQASVDVRAEREWRTGYRAELPSGPPERNTRSTRSSRAELPSRRGPVSRGPRLSTTPLAGVTIYTHIYPCRHSFS